MNEDCDFYICSICFNTSEEPGTCHSKMMVHCRSFQPGDFRLKPLMDKDGDLKTSAPRWFVQYTQSQYRPGKR
jgi:hypothetical protein